ncbi:MAG: Glycosyl transferase group 1 [Candidatus Magasanikbacteria bacterium GW2011_GWA2_46_17]|uniref:Glycosyl transferase group 1 n=1 Tax=Candidatus Magasanikbacteria bacterium GW2011_GWA2_46_17 TaxID=1619042 RepID=A0A0G1P3C7_9BACT|nr:MAG: Glycosyl transferase group 1 [Candidatus Magasanikbacteria bacterium GW2011_GWA2_46_17]HBF67161.1 hypothetical protein [Candidatus Magasanikbacteria bacterium]
MNIGVDIRPLLDAQLTGVGEYTYHLLNTLFEQDTHNEYHLFYNAYHVPPHMTHLWNDKPNVHHKPSHIPNKLLNASLAFLHTPHIDAMTLKNLDWFISPNPHFAAYHPNTQLLQIVHDLTPVLYPEFFSAKMRFLNRFIYPHSFKTAHHFMVVSKSAKEDLQALCDIEEKNITVAYPGLDPLFRKQAQPEAVRTVRERYHLPERFILFLGTNEPRKNIESLVRAFELWNPSDVGLVIAGKQGWSAPLRTKHNKVWYIDYIGREEKPALYAAAVCFVYPSFYEGFGFPPLEALSQGTPVMVSHTSSMGEVFGDNALLIDPWRPGELAELLPEYLTCHGELHPRAARIAFAQSFTWDTTVKKLLDILMSTN